VRSGLYPDCKWQDAYLIWDSLRVRLINLWQGIRFPAFLLFFLFSTVDELYRSNQSMQLSFEPYPHGTLSHSCSAITNTSLEQKTYKSSLLICHSPSDHEAMAFDSRHTPSHSWSAPHVWATAPPKSPTHGSVSSFLAPQEYTPSSPPSSRTRPKSLTLLMNPFSHHHHTAPALQQIEEEVPRAYPTLTEILHNTAPPPYTLSSFMAYLSMMHSLETLEFLLDATRYRDIYQQTFQTLPGSSYPATEKVTTLWQRLINAYVRPGGSREINIPSDLRDTLLRAPSAYTPPPPDMLDASVGHVYNLMRDGALASFIASCDATATATSASPASRADPSFTRNLWNKSPSNRLNRNSSSSNNSSRSSSVELMTPVTSSTSQPISIPTSPHRASFPPSARSVGGFLSQSVANNLEESHLDSFLENTSDEMSDVDDHSRHSSSGRASPMTPPLTPPPGEEGSPVREGGMWGRRVREKFRLRKN
jgi:hypothetical protein